MKPRILQATFAVFACLGFCNLVIAQPAPPTLSSPGTSGSPGPTIANLTPTLTWGASAGATGYGLYIRNQTTGVLIYDNDNVPNGTSLALPAGYLVNGNQYRWNMRAKNASGFGAYTAGYLYFQTPASVPNPPTLSSPGTSGSPGPTIANLTPTFSWGASAGATGYGLYIRDQTTGTLIYDNDNVPNGTQLALPAGYLVNGHEYRWNMRAKNASGFGAYTAGYLYFQTPTVVPDPPTLSSPGTSGSPGPTIANLTPTFSWGASAGATGYGLYIRDQTTGTLIYDNDNVPNGTQLALPAGYLVNGHEYRWNMRAKNGSGFGAYTAGYLYFQTPTVVPDPPVLSSPGTSGSPGPTVANLTPTFTWGASAGATGYGLYIRDQTTGTLIYDNDNVPNGTQLVLPAGYLVNGHEYRWNMRAKNASGFGAYTAGYLYFQTPTVVPDPPTLSSPGTSGSPGPTIANLTPTFSWGASAGATGYGLYIRDQTTGTLIYDNDNVPNGTQLVLPAGYLVNGHEYRWNMRAKNASGFGGYTAGYLYFQTPTVVPDPPVLTSPGTSGSPGPTIANLTPTFSWGASAGATSYGLYIRDQTTGILIYDNDDVPNGTQLALPAGYLVNGHEYRWNMRAKNASGFGAYTAGYLYFQTPIVVPDPPVLSSPGTSGSPGPTVANLTPTFTWGASAGATGYGLYIRDQTTGILIYDNDNVPNGTELALPAGYLVNSHEYRWNMRAKNASGFGAYTAGYLYFQSPGGPGGGPPSAPNLVGPGATSYPGTEVSTLTPSFTWQSVQNAAEYGLYVSRRNGDGTYTLIFDSEARGVTITGNNYLLPAGVLNDGQAYRWNMRSRNAAGWSTSFSSRLYFSVATGPRGFYVSFPLQYNNWTPNTAEIVSVFDHSMDHPYCPDSQVITFTGELGNVIDYAEGKVAFSCGDLWSFKKAAGTPFLANVNYTGTLGSGNTTINYDGHPGYDLRVPIGTSVYAAADGEVVAVDATGNTGSGKYVKVQHPEGYQTLYLHLNEVLVNTTTLKSVVRGQLIGKSGNTGGVSPHLHFEVRKLADGEWKPVDPYGWQGAGQDPYIALRGVVNENLWSASTTPVLSVTPADRTVGAAADNTTFAVSIAGGGTYSASVTDGGSWLNINSGASGGSSGTIACSYAVNSGGQRIGRITVTSPGANGSPKVVTVTQTSGQVAQNPTPQQLSDYADELSQLYKIPSVIIKAVIEQESEWLQFYPDGSPVFHQEPDGRRGYGLMQLTVPTDVSTISMVLGTITEGVPQGDNSFTSGYETVSVDIERLKSDWRYNVEIGTRLLLAKKSAPSTSGGSGGAGDDANILENWYYPVAYFNGAAKYNGSNGQSSNDPVNPAFTRAPSNNAGWIRGRIFPYQECVFNIVAQLYAIPSSRRAYFGSPIQVTLPGPSAVGSGAAHYEFVESVFCFYDWAQFFRDGTVKTGNWGGQNNGCIAGQNTRSAVTFHVVSFGASGGIIPVAQNSPSIAPQGNGQMQLSFQGDANRSYRVLASVDLIEWITIFTTTSETGAFQFIDSRSPNLSHRYYQVVSP